MKKLFTFLILFSILGCKNNTKVQKNEKQDSIVFNNKIIKNEIYYKTLIDSLFLFSMQPSYFKEYHYNTDTNIKNKAYMKLVIEQCNNNNVIPYLIEKITDTTKTKILYANVIPLRISDVALELIEISDKKFNIPDIIFNEFDDSDLVGLDKMREDGVYTVGNVYVPLFFKEPDFKYVNYKNRLKLYQAIKNKHKKNN